MTEKRTAKLDVRGATLTYDVRRIDSTTEPILLMIGSPMAAAGFESLSKHFTDRTVATYDPRGSERSVLGERVTASTPEDHAEDLHRLIAELAGGPVDIFASSGGATNALALVSKHPEQVHTLIAHEPPVVSALPDREAALAASKAIHDAYMKDGFGAGMARFIALVMHKGEVTSEYLDRPAPDPAMFGLPTEDDGSRDDVLLGQNIIGGTHYELDYEALRAASTNIVLAAGVESEGELANRGAHAVAERLDKSAVTFPSDHGGFLGGEYGQMGDPEAFAAKLREVLAEHR